MRQRLVAEQKSEIAVKKEKKAGEKKRNAKKKISPKTIKL